MVTRVRRTTLITRSMTIPPVDATSANRLVVRPIFVAVTPVEVVRECPSTQTRAAFPTNVYIYTR
jgi:hypothetical protein